MKDQNGNTELNDEASTLKVIEHLQDAKYVVENIEKKNRHRSSKPPFITSTLQQDAGARLKYNAKRVMMIAQKLYEGIDILDERVGLITYMRTDSIRLSDDFIASAKTYIEDNYGKNYYKGFDYGCRKDYPMHEAPWRRGFRDY